MDIPRNEKGQYTASETSYRKMFTFRLTESDGQKLIAIAKAKNIRPTTLARTIIEEYLYRDVKEPSFLDVNQLAELLNVAPRTVRDAQEKSSKHFSEYCFSKCGRKFRALDISKPSSKIAKWVYEEID